MDGSLPQRFHLDGLDDCRRGALSVLGDDDIRHVGSILTENHGPLDQIICTLGLATEETVARSYAQVFTAPLIENGPAQSMS